MLVGGGGHALSLGSMLADAGHPILGYTDPADRGLPWPWLGSDGDALTSGLVGRVLVAVAIGTDTALRAAVFGACDAAGARFLEFLHGTASVASNAVIGRGVIAFPGAMIGARAQVADNVFLGPGAVADHETIVGAHSYLAAGAKLGGKVRLGAGTLLGMNAVVLPGLRVAAGTRLGAGAVLLGGIDEPGGRWAGVPARRIG